MLKYTLLCAMTCMKRQAGDNGPPRLRRARNPPDQCMIPVRLEWTEWIDALLGTTRVRKYSSCDVISVSVGEYEDVESSVEPAARKA